MASATFRNEQVAAPLKGPAGRVAAVRHTAFRNEQVAAPLKVPLEASVPPGGDRIPQRTSCGPIEGTHRPSVGSSHPPFRNEQVAAPLKVQHGGRRGYGGQHSATNKLRPH